MKWIMAYVIFQMAVLLILLLISRIKDKRYKAAGANMEGFEKTGEVFIDPVTKERVRVYFNAATGKRIYKNEKG